MPAAGAGFAEFFRKINPIKFRKNKSIGSGKNFFLGGARTTPTAHLGIKKFFSLTLTKKLELKKMYISSESDE